MEWNDMSSHFCFRKYMSNNHPHNIVVTDTSWLLYCYTGCVFVLVSWNKSQDNYQHSLHHWLWHGDKDGSGTLEFIVVSCNLYLFLEHSEPTYLGQNTITYLYYGKYFLQDNGNYQILVLTIYLWAPTPHIPQNLDFYFQLLLFFVFIIYTTLIGETEFCRMYS